MTGRFLNIVEGRAQGSRITLDQVFVIGRGETGTGSLGSDPQISRTHARVYSAGSGECVVEDLGSTNGTLVNGRRIAAPVILQPGDRITVGETVLQYEDAAAGSLPPLAGAEVGAATLSIARPSPAGVGSGGGVDPGFGPGYTASSPAQARPSSALALWGLLLLGAAVAVGLGVYGKEHTPAGRPIFTLGFSGVLQLKTWLSTITLVLIVVQLLSAMWMWGRLPGAGSAPGWVVPFHRWSGSVAFVVSLPVAFHCLWALGFGTTPTRVVVHSIAGCAFYGAYASKMLGLRLRNLPGWTLPVLGGTVFAAFVIAWLTAALWFFTRTGLPLT